MTERCGECGRIKPNLFAKVDKSGDCWLWLGAIRPDGYGIGRWKGKSGLAHRIVYKEVVGQIPVGLVLDHLCRVRHCVNPAHLEPVTQLVNVRRGRGNGNIYKTACKYGHPLSGENLIFTKSGKRACRICKHAFWHKWSKERGPRRKPNRDSIAPEANA